MHCQRMVFVSVATFLARRGHRSLSLLTSTPKVPAVDFRNPFKSRDKLAREIVEALENVGFLYLDNVVDFDSNVIEQATKWFYNLPSNTKYSLACKSWNPQNSNHYRGYFPADPQNSSYKEGFEVCEELTEEQISSLGFVLYEPNQWPSGGKEVKWFRNVVNNYYQMMHKTALEFCSLVACGLGAKEDWFDHMFSPFPLSTLRLINYPPRPKPIPPEALDGNYVLHCGSHSDTPFLTLLDAFDYKGLQIEDSNGKWVDVPVRRNSLIVNIGDVLSRVTSYKLKATKHRVVDMGKQRQSVAYFLEPRFDVNINKVIVGPGFQKENGRPLGYGPWLLQNFKEKEYIEYKDLVSEQK